MQIAAVIDKGAGGVADHHLGWKSGSVLDNDLIAVVEDDFPAEVGAADNQVGGGRLPEEAGESQCVGLALELAGGVRVAGSADDVVAHEIGGPDLGAIPRVLAAIGLVDAPG